ncbi:hypothetical protein FGF80_00785 [Natrinema pallidum]|uniref:Uncharacterized protein n=2 Tax=Natrinema pallidum TaxID=69527 RepID=A0A4P9TB79_9EURY|nr:hypothetical protein [Natrinema pallidum]QCW01861.1 hypothetical protein FGF80_00785 [Natrinema pallidum]
MARYEEPEKMDLLAEKTLTALFKRGRCSTTELKEMTGGKPRLIKHRIDEWLAPAGLVKQCGTRPHAGNDVRVFKLTTEGQRYVSDQWSDLAHYALREEVLDAAREMNDEMGLVRDLLDEIRDNQSDLEESIEAVEDEAEDERGNLKSEFGQWRDRVKELEKENEELREEIKELGERVDTNEERSKKTKKIAEEAWAWTVGNWIDNVRNPDNGQRLPWMDVRGEISGIVARNGPDEKRHKKVSRKFREWTWGED